MSKAKPFDTLTLRLERQRRTVAAFPPEIDSLWVTALPNIRYLTGFSGSSGGLLLTREGAVFFTDFRYQEQSELEIGKAARLVVYKSTAGEAIVEYLEKHPVKKLGVEATMTVDAFETLRQTGKTPLFITRGLVDKVRQIKDAHEMTELRKAFGIADKAFARLLKFIRPGRTESAIAARLEYLMKMGGSEYPSFETIVAAGERSSCPHAHPTDRKVKDGEMVKIDFGAVYHGYHSDMTRTVFVGKATPKFRKVYNAVLEAQRKAIAAIRPGASCKAVDAIAREHIAGFEFGETFGHGLGHALGLEIHESPRFSPKSNDTLEPGMVLTVEPGVYLPGWGGIRIEDVFLVTADGHERITGTPNDLLEIL